MVLWFTKPNTMSWQQQALTKLDQIIALLTTLVKQGEAQAMQEAQIITAETTLHQDLVAQDGLIVQLLTAVANGGFTAAQAAQMLADFQTDDGNAKTRIAAMQAALGGSGSSSSSSTTAPNPPSSTAP